MRIINFEEGQESNSSNKNRNNYCDELLLSLRLDQQVIQSQGCYNDDPKNRAFSYSAQISGLSSEGCIDACRMAGYGYAGIQVTSSSTVHHKLSIHSVFHKDKALLFVILEMETNANSANLFCFCFVFLNKEN